MCVRCNVCPLHCMIPERQVSNSNYFNCTSYLATSGRLMTFIDADNPRPLVMTGPRHSMALQYRPTYIMAITSPVRSVRCCAVVPGIPSAFVYHGSILFYCLSPQQFKNRHQNCHVCLFYESIETGWIETVCFTYIPKLDPVSDSKPKPVSTNGSRL